jgi:tetratricopeptide (TPR) repeat protein
MTAPRSGRVTALRARAIGALATAGMIAGCATMARRPAAAPPPEEGLAGWQALVEGHAADAERGFARALVDRPDDAVALYGQAALADARGAGEAAAAAYVATLAALGGGASPFTAALAPPAAGRLLALYDELGAAARGRIERDLRPAALGRATGLPWLARLELVRLAAHAARQRGDAAGLAAVAAEDGCARQVFDAGLAGPLGALDLDAEPPTARAGATDRWLEAIATGCRVDIPAAPDGRGGARILRTAIEVAAGSYDLVLDYPGEARIAVDGGARALHGAADRYAPRVSGHRIALSAGRHDIELRIASRGGRGALTFLVLPVGADSPRDPQLRFVDPRAAGSVRPSGAPAVPRSLPAEGTLPPEAKGPGAEGLADLTAAYVGDRVEDADLALDRVARLQARAHFAVGLALAGTVARDDPTRPPSFARDAARRLLRAAVAAAPDLARAWETLATVELEDERAREAIGAALAAGRAAPGWWGPDLVRARALAARGLDFEADRALDAGAAKAGAAGDAAAAPCPVIEALLRRAEERRALGDEDRLAATLAGACGRVEARVDRLRARGESAAAIAALGEALALDPAREDLADDLALMLAAAGRAPEGLAALRALAAREPSDPMRRVRLADAQAAAGRLGEARKTIADAAFARPDVIEVRRAARALGVALPLDDQRVDGRAAIAAFEKAAARYAAPAVMVLDRAVMRVFASGAMMTLTHQIVRVDSKQAIERWGEIAVPAGAEILTLRTHKRDGSTREPEEIAGKETISAPDLAIGDYVEWEILETHPPSSAFAPGFLGDRFYFQSFDAPLARSELVLVAPAGMPIALDRRAGPPAALTKVAADGTTVTTFAAAGVPQLFAERAAVRSIEYVPSVRASSGVTFSAWARYVAEELHDAVRSSPEIRAEARRIAATAAGDSRGARAAALVSWVTENVEATDDFAESASATLARGRGSRVTLALALARELGIPARPLLARSRLVAESGAAAPPQELDDFADPLVELDVGAPGKPAPVYADLRLRHAAFGYLPPGIDGARTLGVPDGGFGVARSRAREDRRTVDMTIRLDERGGGVAMATEELVGWPALEWAELVDEIGPDRARLRQDFEQRWLGVQFPGARLGELEIDLPHDRTGRLGTARVRYSFVSSQLAIPVERPGPAGREMRLEPTFFRSQPGRRFAAEAQRATALVLGFDVPVEMTATLELPGAARVDPAALRKDVVITRDGGYRFVEDRRLRPGLAGRPSVLVLHRESALPLMRVAPGDYAAVAADLRRVDGVEQEEIRIRLPPGGRGGAK